MRLRIKRSGLIPVGENSKCPRWTPDLGSDHGSVGKHTIAYIKTKIVLSKQYLLICVIKES